MAAVSSPIHERAEYLKQVLAPADRAGAVPDLFARYGLDRGEGDPGVIEAQLDFAVKLWRNLTGHEKYSVLIRRLLKEHPECERVLRDPAAREAARRELSRSQESADQARVVEFDSLIAELRDGGGALPESARQHLEEVGAEQLGLSPEMIRRRLGAERFVDDIGKHRPCLDRAKYQAVCEQLRTLRGVLHADDVGPTLLSFIGAPFSAGREQLKGLYGSAVHQNDKRPYGDEKTLASRVLVDVRRYLVEGDPDLYRHAVVGEVKDSLRERIRRRKRLHDRLDGRAYRSMVADALRLGLDENWAAVAVRELARSERMAIEDSVLPVPGQPGTGAAPVPPARAAPPVPPARPELHVPPARQGPPVPPAPPVRLGPPVPPAPPVRQAPPVPPAPVAAMHRSRTWRRTGIVLSVFAALWTLGTLFDAATGKSYTGATATFAVLAAVGAWIAFAKARR